MATPRHPSRRAGDVDAAHREQSHAGSYPTPIDVRRVAARSVRISVVVPTLRRVVDLRRCLAALAAQTRPADQIVVVVHESDAATREALEGWAAENLPVVSAGVRAPGLPAALNAGLAAADGDVLCFTDDDAEPWPDWVARIEAHYGDPAVGAVGGRDLLVNAGPGRDQRCSVVGRVFWYGRYVGNHHLALRPAQPVEVDTLKGVNMSYRAAALDGFRFDERLCVLAGSCTELDAAFHLKRGRWRLLYDPAVGVNHHLSARAWGVARSHPDVCYDFAHNYTYVLLKHVSWPRRVAALVYFALVGQRRAWGLLTVVADPLLTGTLSWRGQLWPTARGRLAGVRSYLESRRARRPRP
jgi:glycosyltransferase involved in cell wall biosynthesis